MVVMCRPAGTTCHNVLALHPGDETNAHAFSAAIEAALPRRYNEDVRARMGRNTAASWSQAGLLTGSTIKKRAHPEATYPALVYALYLAHLEGAAGLGLYETLWARILDAAPATIDALTDTAARTGWLDLRRAGGMTEIGFGHLDGLTARGAA